MTLGCSKLKWFENLKTCGMLSRTEPWQAVYDGVNEHVIECRIFANQTQSALSSRPSLCCESPPSTTVYTRFCFIYSLITRKRGSTVSCPTRCTCPMMSYVSLTWILLPRLFWEINAGCLQEKNQTVITFNFKRDLVRRTRKTPPAEGLWSVFWCQTDAYLKS